MQCPLGGVCWAQRVVLSEMNRMAISSSKQSIRQIGLSLGEGNRGNLK
jgi:hypothetical protein